MRKGKICSMFGSAMLAALFGSQFVFAAWQAKPALTRDDVFHILARRVNAQTESPVTDIIAALDEVIEVGAITISDKDGKATAIVKERQETNNPTNKVIRLVFAPAGNQWTWESFENDRRLYPVEKLFPYAKGELGNRRQTATAQWNALLEAMTKQGEAAFKVLETAKAIIRKDPDPLGPVTAARESLVKARQSNDAEAIRAAYGELKQATEPVATLADTFQELKANDAYLRLQEELKGAQNRVAAARKDYLAAVAAYNEMLPRLPFALVAHGLGFTKLEPQIEAE